MKLIENGVEVTNNNPPKEEPRFPHSGMTAAQAADFLMTDPTDQSSEVRNQYGVFIEPFKSDLANHEQEIRKIVTDLLDKGYPPDTVYMALMETISSSFLTIRMGKTMIRRKKNALRHD